MEGSWGVVGGQCGGWWRKMEGDGGEWREKRETG